MDLKIWSKTFIFTKCVIIPTSSIGTSRASFGPAFGQACVRAAFGQPSGSVGLAFGRVSRILRATFGQPSGSVGLAFGRASGMLRAFGQPSGSIELVFERGLSLFWGMDACLQTAWRQPRALDAHPSWRTENQCSKSSRRSFFH